MTLKDAADRITTIPKDRIEDLLRILGDPGDYSWYLVAPHATEKRLQGDIHPNIPTAIIGPDGTVKSRPFTVMVLNNTCDLQEGRSEFVSVIPLLEFDYYERSLVERKGPASAQGTIAQLKANRIFEHLWLPPFPGFEKGAVAYLSLISSMSSAIFEKLVTNGGRIASLSEKGFYAFLIQVTRYLARAESADVARRS